MTFSVICSEYWLKITDVDEKNVRNPPGHGSCIMKIEPLLINKHLMSFTWGNILEYPADRELNALKSKLYAMNSPGV